MATVTCPYCAETIEATAKLCPRCRQWLSLRSLRHPLISSFVLGVPMLAVFVVIGGSLLTTLDRIENPKPYYSEFPGAI